MFPEHRRIFCINMKTARIKDLLEPFFTAKRSEGRAEPTIRQYREKLIRWADWLENIGLTAIGDLTTYAIRCYLLEYRESHNQGGTHSVYRVIKVFLRWAWLEYDFDWPNPVIKVKCSANQIPPIEGVKPEHIEAIFAAAAQGECPERDCAIIAVLLDTGIRRSSLAGIRCKDVDLVNGTIFINHVKIGKQYTVHLGKRARKYIRKYAQTLPESLSPDACFWRSKTGETFRIDNFYSILCRTADRAGVPRYSLHDYRRFFALESYRNGADIYAVAQMLGHTGIGITERYLACDEQDRAQMHAKVSPLDHTKK